MKIIVCDDIPSIRNNIASLLSQQNPNWLVYSDYYDGSQVIEHLKKAPVDLIITDIKMKDITGIDVLKFIHEENLSTRVIIITAYSDFEYAKDAVNYNAARLLVKPLNPHELLSAVTSEIESIHQECAEKASELHVVNQLFLRNKMHRMLEQLHGNRNSFTIFEDYCRRNNPEYLKRRLTYIQLKRRQDIDLSGYFFWHEAAEYHNQYISVYTVAQNATECTLLVFTDASQEGAEQFDSYLQRIKSKYQFTLYPFENISRLYGENSDIAMRYMIYMDNRNYEQKADLEKQIMRDCSVKEMLTIIQRICDHYKLDELSTKIKLASTKEDADKLLQLMTQKLERLLSDNHKQLLCEKIKHYLEENFADPTLSLDSVSHSFNYSPSHMSKLFTDYNGISFSETLTSFRLEHAKKLLKNPNLSIHEVAEACGYNEKYFSKLFTKRIGTNPRTYRDRRTYDDTF